MCYTYIYITLVNSRYCWKQLSG